MLKNLISILIKKIIKGSQGPDLKQENTAVAKNIQNSTVTVNQVIIAGDSFKSSGQEIDLQPHVISDQKTSLSIYIQSTVSSNSSTEINKKIDNAVNFISSKNISQAKSDLFKILGEIEGKKAEFKNELVRVYNNLGVCFNIPRSDGGDYDESIKYFMLALEHDPKFIKAKINLAASHLNKAGNDNKNIAYNLTSELWSSGDINEKLMSTFLPAYTWSIFYKKSVKEAIDFVNQENVKAVFEKDANLQCIVAKLHFENSQFDETIKHSTQAIKLDPASFESMALKAFALISKAQKKAKRDYYKVVPEFEDLKDIEEALVLLENALSGLQGDSSSTDEIKLAIDACAAWLNRANEAKYKEIKKSISITNLSPEQVRQLEIFDFVKSLRDRNFDIALQMFIQNKDFKSIPYEEKHRIASIFLMEGAIEQSMAILELLEDEATSLGDVQYWLTKSALFVLLNDKNLAIQNADIAKNKAKGTPDEKKALSHFNAIMLRYAKKGESDRLLKGMFEYDKRFPEDKIVTSIKTTDEDGEMSDEFKTLLLKQKAWFENIRKKFTEQPAITYFLEEILHRPYIEVISVGIDNRDPAFVTHFSLPNQNFIKEIRENFVNAKSITMDYGALLNLSKMGVLGHLSKFNIPIVISKNLFRKIQTELLHTEDEDLRRLWEFLRKTRVIKLSEGSSIKFHEPRINEVFDPWLVDTFKISKNSEFVFIVDDLRLLQCANSEAIKTAHSLQVLLSMLDRGWIDKKMYAEGLGDLAERFYIFLSYTGEDLFYIVAEDKMKITLRSNHLVNQLFLPGSDFGSFTTVFLKFIDMLWSTGSLPEDKCDWLKYISDTINKYVSAAADKNPNKEDFTKLFLQSVTDFASMWEIAIHRSSKDELLLLDKRIDEILKGSVFNSTITKLHEVIAHKLASLTKLPKNL